MNRWFASVLVCGSLLAASGCTEIQECMISARNRSWAHSAWHGSKREYPRMPHHVKKHFSRGWRDGYYNVAQGGGSRLPLLPPQRYWGAHFQNPLGHDETKAWFEGYQAGVIAAESDGVDHWVQIPVNHLDSHKHHPVSYNQPASAMPYGEEIGAPAPEYEGLPSAKTTRLDGAPRVP